MTDLERLALEKVITVLAGVAVRNKVYDGNLQLVEGGPSPDVVDDPKYRMGWQACHAAHTEVLTDLFIQGDEESLKKFVGDFGKNG